MIRPGKTVISDMIYTKRLVGLKFLRREDTNLFQLDKTVPLGGELCKEIPSHGFEALLQSCTTQRLTGTYLSFLPYLLRGGRENALTKKIGKNFTCSCLRRVF